MIKHYHIIKGFADSSVEFLKVTLADHAYPVHYHKRYCAGMVVSGAMYLECGGSLRELKKGDFFYIPAFKSHSIEVKNGNNVRYSAVSFMYIDDVKRLRDNPVIMKEIEKFDLRNLIDYACTEPSFEDQSQCAIIQTLIEYIDHHYMNPLTIDELSCLVDLSFSRMQHVFKENMGLSLKQYILQEKVRKSKDMLTGKTMTDVALDCGFYDQSHFIRNFKRHTGISPMQYSQSIYML